MNAPVVPEQSLSAVHSVAVEHVNAWRGRCVNLFARGERLIAERISRDLPATKLPTLLSRKLQLLTRAVAEDARASQAIADFADLADVRNALVHGGGKVFVDGKGQWLLRLSFLDPSGIVRRDIAESEGSELQRRLHKAVQRLESVLGR